MTAPDRPESPMHEPLAALEADLIDEYLRTRGHDPAALRVRTDAEARGLLRDASFYASMKLTEVETRAHYVQEIHRHGER